MVDAYWLRHSRSSYYQKHLGGLPSTDAAQKLLQWRMAWVLTINKVIEETKKHEHDSNMRSD